MEKNERPTRVEMSRGDIDWIPVRECFIRAFHRYPLYKYLIPNENIREEFLRRYLEANYDVTVRKGRSILLAINLYKELECPVEEQNAQKSVKRTVVGGVLFVPPAQSGGGWEYANDEVYWDAYERYKLKEVDSESLERVIRYENWETKNVGEKVCAAGIPLWNGLFCAIDPAHAGSGCGSMNYADCMKIMAQVHRKNQMQDKAWIASPAAEATNRENKSVLNVNGGSAIEKFGSADQNVKIGGNTTPSGQTGLLNRLSQLKKHENTPLHQDTEKNFSFGVRLMHALSLLHHRPRTFSSSLTKPMTKKEHSSTRPTDVKPRIPNMEAKPQKPCLPMVVALSHSLRAVSFHKKNGFQLAGQVPFSTKTSTPDESLPGTSPFNVHVLIMDPFNTGMTDEVARAFELNSPIKDVAHAPVVKREVIDGRCASELQNSSLKPTQSILQSTMGSASSLPIR